MKTILKSEKGMTLIEVLATLVITAILTSVIYSVYITGMKLYQKIGIESQLRDDADYTVTTILNELYNRPPNFVKNYTNDITGAVGIEMVRYQPKTLEGFIVEDSSVIEDHILIYQEDERFFIETLNSANETESKTEIETGRAVNTTYTNGATTESSSISISSCSETNPSGDCRHGRISLNLVYQDRNHDENSMIKIKPLVLKSSFGF